MISGYNLTGESNVNERRNVFDVTCSDVVRILVNTFTQFADKRCVDIDSYSKLHLENVYTRNSSLLSK